MSTKYFSLKQFRVMLPLLAVGIGLLVLPLISPNLLLGGSTNAKGPQTYGI